MTPPPSWLCDVEVAARGMCCQAQGRCAHPQACNATGFAYLAADAVAALAWRDRLLTPSNRPAGAD